LAGSGLVSLLRSRAAGFLPNSILNGELRASIPEGDEHNGKFVAIVLREARARAQKVVSVDAATGQRGTKADRKFIAGPDAVRKFDGVNGAYLDNGAQTLLIENYLSERNRTIEN